MQTEPMQVLSTSLPIGLAPSLSAEALLAITVTAGISALCVVLAKDARNVIVRRARVGWARFTLPWKQAQSNCGHQTVAQCIEGAVEANALAPYVASGTCADPQANGADGGPTSPQVIHLVVVPVGGNVHSVLSIGQDGFALHWKHRHGRYGEARLTCLSDKHLERGKVHISECDNKHVDVVVEIAGAVRQHAVLANVN